MTDFVRFEGEITTVTPLFQTIPDGDKNKTNMMKVYHENEFTDVAIISPNTMRSIIRKGISRDILEKIGDGRMDYQSLGFLVVGGNLEAKKKGKKDTRHIGVGEELQTIADMKKRNIVASLLGGGAGKVLIDGKLTVIPAILICRETANITKKDSQIPASRFISSGFSVTRNDLILKDREFFNKLSQDGVEDLERRYLNHKELTRKKKNKEEDIDMSEGKTLANMISKKDYVIPGARFYHMIEIPEPSDAEIGAIYSALRRFAARPRIGSMKSSIGEVSATYEIRNSEGQMLDTIIINDRITGKQFSYGESRYLDAYRQYIENLTLEDVTLPQIFNENMGEDDSDGE
ncbi:MAG: hypothetical protein QW561_04975 [Candidatus Aenigmatarchaeota archaeon]